MNCKQVLARIHDFVDGELESGIGSAVRQHLAACADCKRVSLGIARLKCLLKDKVEKPRQTALLSAVIGQQIQEKSRRFSPARTRVVAAAALLLAAGSVTLALILNAEPRLGHAEVASACVKAFNDFFRASEKTVTEDSAWREAVRQEIRKTAGIAVDHVPTVPNARYVSWEAQTLKNVKGVRLDFKPFAQTDVNKPKSEQQNDYWISVFLLPLKNMRFGELYLKELEKGHPCTRCIQLEDGAIYCFRSKDFLISAVTNLDEKVLLEHHLPR